MKDPRNPFRMRASEQIASETTFLKLFGAGALECVPEAALEGPWIIRSAPGGGKTSLLRVFTPASLTALHANRTNDDFRDLYARMKDIGAVDDTGPQLLATMISCNRNYASLEDFTRDRAQAKRLFFALLDCRVILGFIHGALALKDIQQSTGLDRLTLRLNDDTASQLGLPTECSGRMAFDWARTIESNIGQALDSFDSHPPSAPGHDTPLALQGLAAAGIIVDGTPVASRLLVMFDDVHKLAPEQRLNLGQTLSSRRGGIPAWIAERLEALSSEELLDMGSRRGRDYDHLAPTLEDFWRGHNAQFEKAVASIADKRVREARSVEIDSFVGCVEGSIEAAEYQPALEKALSTVSGRVRAKYRSDPRFVEWDAQTEFQRAATLNKLSAWRTIEVVLTRQPKKQLTLDLDAPSEEAPKRADDAGIRAAAERFLSIEFDLPYYYGFSRLALLSSSNIEQFLAISGDIFEEIGSNVLLRRSNRLSLARQDRIVRSVASKWWEQDLLRTIPMRTEVRNLVESIGRYAKWETNRPNAPYAPGVTGISITMTEREILCDRAAIDRRPDLQRLAAVLGICLAYNIMDAQMDRSQGYRRRMVLYLNRLLCAHFELPLQYGGWRPKRLEELSRWIKEGYRPPNGEGERLI